MNMILIGLKHCGKTTIGKRISEKTNQLLIDTDRLIEEHYSRSENTPLTVREIYQSKGDQYFRNLEKYVIITLDNIDDSVIATGGGTVLDNDNVSRLKKRGKLIYLYLSLDAWLVRLQSQTIPASTQAENSFDALYQQRETIYKQVADMKVSVENKSISDIAEEILMLIRRS